MKIVKKILLIIFVVLLLAIAYFLVNTKTHLRGNAKKSPDGKTYLVVADDNGGQCGPLKVDGVPWPHKLNESGAISSGLHKIECGGIVEFEIPAGTTFRFDYWGP